MTTKRTNAELQTIADHYDTSSAANESGTWIDHQVADEPMVVRSIRMPYTVVRDVRAIAEERGVPATELMRTWIEDRLAEERSGSGLVGIVAGLLKPAIEAARKNGVRVEGRGKDVIVVDPRSGVEQVVVEIKERPARQGALTRSSKEPKKAAARQRKATAKQTPTKRKAVAAKPSVSPRGVDGKVT